MSHPLSDLMKQQTTMKYAPLFFVLMFCICMPLEAQLLCSQPFDSLDMGNWSMSRDKSMVVHQIENGNGYLLITDADDKLGSSIDSPLFPAQLGNYIGTLRIRQLDGMGFGLQIHAYDAKKNYVGNIGGFNISSRAASDEWTTIQCTGYVDSPDIAFVQLRYGSWSKAIIKIMTDDATLTFTPAIPVAPAWQPQYKIKPDQTDKLTAADVVGPDGVVYPNWTRAGKTGGIPKTFKNSVKLADFAGLPDDGKDDATAIEQAVKTLAAHGGGMIELGNGTYDLLRPVIIRDNNIVISGQGTDKTKINFRYAIADGQVAFFGLHDGQTIGPATDLVCFTPPAGFKSMQLDVDGKKLDSFQPSMHSGNRSYLFTKAEKKPELFTAGEHQLTATADYADGSKRASTLTVRYDPSHVDPVPIGRPDGAIAFHGSGYDSDPYPLAADGKRGSMQVTLKTTHDLKPGQWVCIRAVETPARRELTKNACTWGLQRNYQLLVTHVDDNNIAFDRPLRLDFPVADESYIQRIKLIENCGVKDMTIEQTQDMWLTGVQLTYALNCWAQRVNVIKCGRHPIYGNSATQCEIRDCTFTEAWFKGGGGTAYVGWEKCYDSLMENVTTTNMRHAPLFQWSASGNVIRDSTFHNSDAQWHSGWTNENLMENCVITSVKGNGGYGFGMWASPPEDGAHGPNGPRNVVYNCDVTSQLDGLWIGGMNENWLILHNRFIVDKGVGIFTKDNSFDHIIKGNVFVLKDKTSPMVKLLSPDCSGVDILDNVMTGGNGKLVGGLGRTALVQDNTTLPAAETLPARPSPQTPSIYLWQQQSR